MNGFLGQFGVICSLLLGIVPAIAQPLNSSSPKIEQVTQVIPDQTVQTSLPVPISSERSTPNHSIQALDGANTMLLKLIYLGLPGAILIGISLRTLHLHREIMRQRAFVESLERIWQRTVSY